MNWIKLLYVVIIALLYVPMVFLGANVFFPQYTGNYQYPIYDDCWMKYPGATEPAKLNSEQLAAADEQRQKCQQEMQQKQQQWEIAKLNYEGSKYVFMALFNLAILALALFLPFLQDSVALGLFLGSVVATFAGTLRYWDTNSKIGFIILVITFFAVIFFINRKKDSFLDWNKK